MPGFTRILYKNGSKFIMMYPPGWRPGDPRQPKVHKEPCVPGPSGDPSFDNHASEPRAHPDGLPDHQLRSPSPDSRDSDSCSSCSSMDDEWSEGSEHAENTDWSYPLKTYLTNLWLPRYKLSARVDLMRYQWPILQGLAQPPLSRKLYMVERIFEWDLSRGFDARACSHTY